jgi:hypothetical protein
LNVTIKIVEQNNPGPKSFLPWVSAKTRNTAEFAKENRQFLWLADRKLQVFA